MLERKLSFFTSFLDHNVFSFISHGMKAHCLSLVVASALLLPSSALSVKMLGEGYHHPIWAGAVPSNKNILWVIEQPGIINSLDNKSGEKKVILDMVKLVQSRGNEQGLLGLAFDPKFSNNGRFYINYIDREEFTCISRLVYKDGKIEGEGEIILRFKQPFSNHNGGWLDIGGDNMLYIGTGDGGSGNDPQQNAQSLKNLLGKILRIDISVDKGYKVPKDNPFVKTKDAMPEIYSYGLRNPWRCSFDKKTGDLWIGDVGQNLWEEINHTSLKEAKGANFGWRLREGDVATPSGGVGGDAPKGAIEPVYVYRHGGAPNEGNSVTGGYIYHGPIKSLQGRYIFADYQFPRVWSFAEKNHKATDVKDHIAEINAGENKINNISSLGEDAEGNIIIIEHGARKRNSGAIYLLQE